MRVKLTNSDLIWSYVGTAFSMASNLIMLPFLMHFLDGDMLGMWYVFTSVGAITTLFDFGFSVTFARNITYCWSGAKQLKKESVVFVEKSDPDYSLMKRVLITCRYLYGVLSGFALLILLTVGTVYISYIGREIPGKSYLVSWVIYSIAAFLNLYYGYYSSFLRGVGAVDRANINTIIARVIQIAMTLLLLFLGMGLVGACISYLAYGTIFRLLGKNYFYKYQGIGENLKKIHEKISVSQIKDTMEIVWHNAWRDGLISVSSYLCNHASTVICSMYLPLSQTGAYSIGVQAATAISQIAGTLYNAYQPELQYAYINKQSEKTRKIMSIIVMSYVYLFILGSLLFCIVGLPLLRLIRPSAVVATPVLLGLCAYQFTLKFRNCYSSYFSCTNRIIYVKGFVVSAFNCVIFSLIALGLLKCGVWGLIVAQIASQAIYNLWRWPYLAHKEMGLSISEMIIMGTKEGKALLLGFVHRN